MQLGLRLGNDDTKSTQIVPPKRCATFALPEPCMRNVMSHAFPKLTSSTCSRTMKQRLHVWPVQLLLHVSSKSALKAV